MSRTAGAGARYTTVAIMLHWLIALAIFEQIALGLAMTQSGLAPVRQFQLFQLHKSVGITILLLVLLRVLWRFLHRPPPLPAAMPTAERRAADGTHLVFYALLLFMPITGWAVVSASPFNIPTVLYGVVPWPHLPVLPSLHDKAPVEAALKAVHAYGAWVLIALLVLHLLAVLRHVLVLDDDVLWRMLPLFPRPNAPPRAEGDPGRVP